MKLVAVLITLAGVGLSCVLLVRGVSVEKFRDKKVTAGEVRRPWDLFAVHVSRPQYLTVAGKTYRGVRGMAPYYLDVPGTNSILFVTQAPGDHITFHILNLGTKEEVQIDGGTSGFGWHLGGPRKPGDKFTDYIEGAQSNRLTLVKRTDDWMERTVLNLATKLLEREETFYFNASGQVTNRSTRTPADL